MSKILSRASKAGSPKNRLGSGPRRDMGRYRLTDYKKIEKYGPIWDLFYWGRVSLARHNT